MIHRLPKGRSRGPPVTISTRDQLIDALANNSSRIVIDKASLLAK